ncbi:hypothetical protein [Streptomyces rugosispiralis]|uniref:Uncharacterized protein n=1 Tax=Streptomyces rugosispiralis TaxID=2967341 RepID=A0ABT1URZ2_9ACTN|nr:hypothetical protein [Streptomyces rugosispiralis]MCQ8187364.1 hypothetical protein [Streptomyces rugosispiralis]
MRTEPAGAAVGGHWKPWFVPGSEWLADWSAALGQLTELGFTGPVCPSGQYSGPGVPVEKRLVADLAAARDAAGAV